MLTFDDLDDWLDELGQVDGVASAVLDPAQLRAPGVWAQMPAFGIDTMEAGAYRLDLQLHLVVGDQDWRQARNKLAALFDAVHGHLGRIRVDPVQFLTLATPGGQALPCLRFPYTLRIQLDD